LGAISDQRSAISDQKNGPRHSPVSPDRRSLIADRLHAELLSWNATATHVIFIVEVAIHDKGKPRATGGRKVPDLVTPDG
jgi:hypothetical protein